MTQDEIREQLFRLRDEGYARMQKKIIPTVKEDRVIGVRTPALRALAKELYGNRETEVFLKSLPHPYFAVGSLVLAEHAADAAALLHLIG